MVIVNEKALLAAYFKPMEMILPQSVITIVLLSIDKVIMRLVDVHQPPRCCFLVREVLAPNDLIEVNYVAG